MAHGDGTFPQRELDVLQLQGDQLAGPQPGLEQGDDQRHIAGVPVALDGAHQGAFILPIEPARLPGRRLRPRHVRRRQLVEIAFDDRPVGKRSKRR